jgi:AraC-like DNA-binding protein
MQTTYERLRVDENCLLHFQEFKQKRFTSPFHVHEEFELILIKKSHGKLYVGNEVTNFNDNSVFLFAPFVPHCFHNTKDYEKDGIIAFAVVIQFKSDFLGEDFFNKTECYKLKKLISRSEAGVQFQNIPKNTINRILKLDKPNNLQKLGKLLIVLSELANHKEYTLLSSANLIPNLFDSNVINDVVQYVAENFQNKISLDRASELANMQKSAFCRYFKRKTKKRFMEFVNETRLAHAIKLLVETDKNILEIAFECGYESSSYFYRLFSKQNKVSPQEYRKQSNEKYIMNN